MLKKVLQFFKPVQMMIQRVGYIEPRFTEEEIEELVLKIQPGDTLGSFEQLRLTSKLIPGDYDHVAMVAPNKDVIEAVGDEWVDSKGKKLSVLKTYLYKWFKRPMKNLGGVRRVGLRAWLYRKHELFVARHYNPSVANIAAKYAAKIKGNYDYAFRQGDKSYSCVEVNKESYQAGDPKFMYGNKTPLPIHFMSDKNMTVIYDSKRMKV